MKYYDHAKKDDVHVYVYDIKHLKICGIWLYVQCDI